MKSQSLITGTQPLVYINRKSLLKNPDQGEWKDGSTSKANSLLYYTIDRINVYEHFKLIKSNF